MPAPFNQAMATESSDDFQAALLDLQLQVARRADELARTHPGPGSLKLHCWLLAEEELLHHKAGVPLPPPLPHSAINAELSAELNHGITR